MMGLGGTEIVILILSVVVPVLSILATFCLVPAIQARHRGYSFFVWFFAGLVAFNPVFLLLVLASIPHRKRQRLRDQFRRDLDAKLAAAGVPVVLPAAPVPGRSLGDQPTQMPGAAAETGATAVRDRSLGDAPTVPPDARSLGDEATVPPDARSLGDEATRP